MRPPVPVGEIPHPLSPTPADEEYGHQVLNGLSERYPLDYNDPRYAKVEEIVERLTEAAGVDQDPWHVYLFHDANFKNAAATRGNHVFIWSGMLDEVRSDDELAAILAHEISHVLARHTDPDPNEELKKILIDVGAMAAGIAVGYAVKSPSMGQNIGDLTSAVTKGVGHGFLVNPYSRELEFEADQIGLFLMAKAGYDPEGAISFWKRAEHNPAFSSSLSFLSTHPPAADRLTKLQEMVAQAKATYHGEPVKSQPAADREPVAPAVDTGPANDFEIPSTSAPSPSTDSTLWRVTKDRTVVYTNRSEKSKALGEFTVGSIVSVIGEKSGWLEILGPDHGYIRRSALERLSR